MKPTLAKDWLAVFRAIVTGDAKESYESAPASAAEARTLLCARCEGSGPWHLVVGDEDQSWHHLAWRHAGGIALVTGVGTALGGTCAEGVDVKLRGGDPAWVQITAASTTSIDENLDGGECVGDELCMHGCVNTSFSAKDYFVDLRTGVIRLEVSRHLEGEITRERDLPMTVRRDRGRVRAEGCAYGETIQLR